MSKQGQYELNFLEALKQYEQSSLSLNSLAGQITRKLEQLAQWARVTESEDDAKEIEELAEQFGFIAGDTTATEDELNQALEQLYDWADGPVYDAQGQQVSSLLKCRVRSHSS
jgi:ABC-type transporter Mla subunit MlaD